MDLANSILWNLNRHALTILLVSTWIVERLYAKNRGEYKVAVDIPGDGRFGQVAEPLRQISG